MANLLQDPFKPWVKKQIETRQSSLGKYSNISNDDLKFYSTSAPFLRLASSVDLTREEVINLIYSSPDEKARIEEMSRTSGKQQTLKTYYEERAQKALTFTSYSSIKSEPFRFKLENSVLDKILKNPKLTENDLIGSALAKNFILQGGATNINAQMNSGLSTNTFNGAYGWGGISERGYVPMPGIESAQVNYKNNGALSETTIKIKAFSREQFSLIDVLYMRPGYSVLLEFGHSVYLDNEGKLQTWNNFLTDPLSKFLDGSVDQYELLKLIEKEKEKFQGNYEAIFGKVTKFNWNINQDGSYDIEIKVTGTGDVIESLKINLQLGESLIGSENQVAPVEGEEETEEQTDPPLVADRDKSSLNRFLYKLSNVEDSLGQTIGSTIGFEGLNANNIQFYKTKTYQYFNTFAGGIPLPPFDNFPLKEGEKYKRVSKINPKIHVLQFFNIKTDAGDELTKQTFIQFAHLLAFIESELMLFDGDTPLTRFDFDYYNPDKDENYMLTFPGQLSADPRVCIIPITNNNASGLELIEMRPPVGAVSNYIEDVINQISYFTTSDNGENNSYVGRLGSLFINANYIAETLANAERDESGDISILDFLNSILSGVSEALGGVNQFRVTFDESTGTIRFYEDAPQRFNNPKQVPDYTILNIHGVSPGSGSFVKNVSLNSELSNKFATQVSIGAQAGGNELSGNATSFTSYNRGLEDRIIKTKTNKSNLLAGLPVSPKEVLINNWGRSGKFDGKAGISYAKIYRRLSKEGELSVNLVFGGTTQFVPDPYLYYTAEYIDILKEFNKQYASVVVGSLQQEDQIAPFFLPFNLKLKTNGMGGMVLYQQFTINTKLLPASYDEVGVNYLIKGLNHSINANEWETEIETTPVPVPNVNPINKQHSPGNNTSVNAPITTNIFPPNTSTDKFNIIDNITDGGTAQYSTFGKIISKEELVSRLHPQARPNFLRFFTQIENNYKGYSVKVNSMGRGLQISQDFKTGKNPTVAPADRPKQPWAGGSNHNYFMAIDMNVILPNGKTLRKSEGLNDWLETNIPDIAKTFGLEWGGTYKNYADFVHFGVPFNKDKALDQLVILYPKFKPNQKNEDAVLIQIDQDTKNGKGISDIELI